MIVAIHDDIFSDSPVTCEATTTPGYVTLAFRDGKNATVSIHLPDKMAACVAMIAESFNAHRSADPIHSSAAAVAALAVAGNLSGLTIARADTGTGGPDAS